MTRQPKPAATRKITPQKARRGPYVSEEDLEKVGTGGLHLRQWRAFREMTVADLAEAADVSEGLISGIEGGTGGYSYVTLHKLAGALNTTVGHMFAVNPLKAKAFWTLYDRMDDDQRAELTDHAEIIVKRRR